MSPDSMPSLVLDLLGFLLQFLDLLLRVLARLGSIRLDLCKKVTSASITHHVSVVPHISRIACRRRVAI